MAEKDDKKNTDLWKQKQEEKKKRKEAEAQGEVQPSKADKKKEKKKQDKPQQQRQKASKEDNKNVKAEEKVKQTPDKQTDVQKIDEPHAVLSFPHKKLIKIDELLSEKDRASRIYQEQLINKYLEQYLSENDTVLYVGDKSRDQRQQQVYVEGLNQCSQAELVCRYSDLSYFLENSVTKIFIEAEYIFSNGSILAKRGALNVALMANFYNLPVIAVGGSWTYNGWAPVSYEALEEKYGCEGLKGFDWVEDRYLRGAVAEVGVINPRQVSIYPPLVYKQLELLSVEW